MEGHSRAREPGSQGFASTRRGAESRGPTSFRLDNCVCKTSCTLRSALLSRFRYSPFVPAAPALYTLTGWTFATMHALRLHKGTVPGRERAKEARRLQQATRQRSARSSILQSLRTFLTADSFMYGPLMESPPIVHINDDSEPHTPDREQENGGFDDGSTRDDTNGVEENDTNSGKNIDNGHDESASRRYPGSRPGSRSKTILSVQRTSARVTRTVLPPADGSRTPSSTARVIKPSRNGT